MGERSIKVADGHIVDIEGIGSFFLELLEDFQLSLDNVLLCS